MTARPPLPYDFMPAVPAFTLESTDVAEGQQMSDAQVFDGFGMTGQNISPQLSWHWFHAVRQSAADPAPRSEVARLPRGDQELRGDLLRPRRPHRIRVLASGPARRA